MSATTLSLPAASAVRSVPSVAARMRSWLAACLREAQLGSHAVVQARRELAVEFSELSRGYPAGRANTRWY